MGYYISLEGCDFFIPADKKPEGLKLIHDLMGKVNEFGYDYVSTTAVLEAPTLEAAMQEWGYTPNVDELGNIDGIQFEHSKIGQEELMFAALAPVVNDGSYLEISGEDGDRWRWLYRDGKMIAQTGRIVYE